VTSRSCHPTPAVPWPPRAIHGSRHRGNGSVRPISEVATGRDTVPAAGSGHGRAGRRTPRPARHTGGTAAHRNATRNPDRAVASPDLVIQGDRVLHLRYRVRR